MQKKVLVFHIGDHKTGTTSLQNALAAGLIRPEGVKLHYPAPLNHNYLIGQIRAYLENRPPPKLKDRLHSLAELADQVRAAGPGYTVISGEVFENLPPKKFAKIIDSFFTDCADEIRIIAYVRPHAQRLLSSYAEQIKIGWFTGTIEDFFAQNLASKRFHFAPRFAAWQRQFGTAFRLRPMVRTALRGGSVLEDFSHTAFDGMPCQIWDADLVNESPSLQDLVLLKFLQSSFQDKDKWLRHTLGWEFARRLVQLRPEGEDRPEKLTLSVPLLQQIKEAYTDDADAVDSAFFPEDRWLSNAFDKAPKQQTAQSLDADKYFNPQTQRHLTLMAEIIHDMLDRKAGWPSYFHRHRLDDVARLSARSESEVISPRPQTK